MSYAIIGSASFVAGAVFSALFLKSAEAKVLAAIADLKQHVSSLLTSAAKKL